MNKLLFRLGILLFLGLTTSMPSLAAEPGAREFQLGISAFKQKKYKSALAAFVRAQRAGNTSPKLDYNLGVCYYKLKQYQQAERSFMRLNNHPQFSQLANYNLGLVALKQDDIPHAVEHFTLAANAKRDKKISSLATHMLNELQTKKSSVRQQAFSAGVSLSIGHDDNVTLVSSGSPTSQTDNYLEGFAYLNKFLNPDWQFQANLLWIDYFDVNGADFRYLSGEFRYRKQIGTWQLSPSIGLAQSQVNGTSYQQIVDLRFTADKQLNNTASLRLRYRYSDINSQNTLYDYLQGSRQQLRVEYKDQLKAGQLRLRYELELNNRQNLPTVDYSPTRHTLRARLKHNLSSQWEMSEELALRFSDYGAVAGTNRSDDQLRLQLSATRKLLNDWDAGIRYTRTDNNSNLTTEDYTRNDIQLFTDYRF